MEFNPAINSSELNSMSYQAGVREAQAAEDFEALFVQMFLKEMRPKIEDGLFHSGDSEEMFYQFFDEAVAKEVAKSDSGFGLKQQLGKELF